MRRTRYMTKNDVKTALLAAIVYSANYIARYNFSAALVEMVNTFGADSKALLGLALTLSSISYGGGQIISGIFGDRIPPRYMVALGLFGSGLCNVAVGLSDNVTFITVLWFCNGLCQALIWPSLVRQMTCDMTAEGYQHGIVWASAGCSFATVLVYLAIVPVSILISSWRLAFYFAGGFAALIAILWFFSVRTIGRDNDVPAEPTPTEESAPARKRSALAILFFAGVPVIYLVIACQGLLRDGVTNWMPTLISETYDLGSVASIMSSAVLPLFSTISVFAVGALYLKIRNELTTTAILWGIGTLSTFFILFFLDSSPVLTVILLAILMSCVHGINHVLTARMPRHFASVGLVSTASGLLSSATYVGSAASGYGIAVFSDAYGWNGTIVMWGIVGTLGLLVTIAVFRRWKRFIAEHP